MTDMRIHRPILFFVALGLSTSVSILFGASLARGLNYDLVNNAEWIFLARAVDFEAVNHLPGKMPLKLKERLQTYRVTFDVLRVIKGEYPSSVYTTEAVADSAGPLPAQDFIHTREGSGGLRGCVFSPRPGFREGNLYLLMLGADQKLILYRGNEEVANPSAPWVRMVDLYTRIAALDDYAAEKMALEAALERLPNEPEFADCWPSVTADIERALTTPSPNKPLPELMAMFAAAATTAQRAQVVAAVAATGSAEAGPILLTLLEEPDSDGYFDSILGFFERTGLDEVRPRMLTYLLGLPEGPTRDTGFERLVMSAPTEQLALFVQAYPSLTDFETELLATRWEDWCQTDLEDRLRAAVGGDYSRAAQLSGALGACGDPRARAWFDRQILEGRDDLAQWADTWLR